jgi:hypothetical protein
MSTQTDWQSEAKRAADHAYQHLFEAHRGAIPWGHTGVTAVFGNDGYETDDPRARAEVALLRKELGRNGLAELGFAVGQEEGYTWAMLVRTADHAALHEAVWAAYEGACREARKPGVGAVQYPIAGDVFSTDIDGLRPSLN